MHLTLLLRDESHDRKIADEAIQQKLWLSALSLSYIGRFPRQGLVLGFGNAPVKQIPGAVALLKRILDASMLAGRGK
jgi:DNA-binding transcriptional MocR family regulator